MGQPIVCKRKGKTLALSLFLIGLAILSYTGSWWPGIMLAVGIPLALKQYVSGKSYDTFITLLVFVGGFFSVEMEYKWAIVLPVLFTVGGIYIFARDFLEDSLMTEAEKEEDLNEEIEENTHE